MDSTKSFFSPRNVIPVIRGIILNLKTTKNFWRVFLLRFSRRPQVISFRAGFKNNLTYPEYRKIRNDLASLASKGYIVSSDGYILFFKRDRLVFAGPQSMLSFLNNNPLEELYGVFNYDNKVVLDIGGFMGETAVFFKSRGAKKIIIYEPVSENHRFIKINTSLNGVDAEVHVEGIGGKDGFTIVKYDMIKEDFGLTNIGCEKKEIRVRDVENVLEESHADIAKFDCEGAEITLTSVKKGLLRIIPCYIIECHSPEIRSLLIQKFTEEGFELVKELIRGKFSQDAPFKGVSTVSFRLPV